MQIFWGILQRQNLSYAIISANTDCTTQEQGLQQGALRQLLRVLTLRFEEVPSNLETSLQGLTVEQLEELVEKALRVDSLESVTRL